MLKRVSSVIIVFLVFILVFSLGYIVYWLYSTDFNGFGLVYDNIDILKNTSNVSMYNGDTIQIKYYYGDTDDIEAYIEPIELDEDFTFTVDGEVKSWNTDVVMENVDYKNMFDLHINDDSNTVTVYGSVLQALKRFFVSDNITLNSDLPSADMFKFYVKSSDTTITVKCRIYANVTGIELTDDVRF